jgi:hypothetical protein
MKRPQPGTHEATMLDATMLILGIGSFALFLGYVTVCEHL